MYRQYYDLYFTTATILEWKHLLKSNTFKDIIIESLRYLVQQKKAVVFEFVIMPNHIHLIWYIPEPNLLVEVKASLLSYTAHQFKKVLQRDFPRLLMHYKVDLKDRQYQFWERNALSIAIFYDKVFWQKANYVRWNPCAGKWQLAEKPEDYKYSSVYKNEDGSQYWDFVVQY